jgi:mono/diheme cytochrome c family protein
MRKPLLPSCLLGVVLLVAGAAAAADDRADAVVARGKALTDAGDCAGCHTADASRPFAGGREIPTPFGTIYSPNLTPDRDTGIGAWSDDDFYRAMHDGVAPDGTRYYPAFPYPYFTRLTRSDVLAIKAYLATLPAVRNTRRAAELKWPLNHRIVMRGWNLLFFRPATFQPDPAQNDVWNRGAYLVNGPGHCGACHTPKNFLGADRSSKPFEGGAVDGWYAPRLAAAARSGLASWSLDDIKNYLKTGRSEKSYAAGPMADVVRSSTSKLADADIHAIATYLKSLPAGSPEPAVAAPASSQMRAGEKVYRETCSACHELDGEGSPGIFPPLPRNSNLQVSNPASIIRIVLDGAVSVTTAQLPNPATMPAYAGKMSNEEIAAVVTYMRNAWGNAASPVTPDQVSVAREATKR